MVKRFIIITLFVVIAMVGCSGNKGEANKKAVVTLPKIEENKDLTKKITDEEKVMDGKAYVQGDTAFATLVIKKGIKKEEYDVLVNKYVQEMKNNYKGKKINVQAVQDGKNIADIKVE